MNQPYGKGFHVGTHALREEAELWDDRSSTISEIGKSIGRLTNAPDFEPESQKFRDAYDALQRTLVKRCTAGNTEMNGTATALRWIAERFEFVDRRHEAEMLGFLTKLKDYGGGGTR
jgi:hypothetical protein